MSDLTISVINYKTASLTENCLKSVLNNKWQNKIEVFLVDNASGDGSFEYLKERFPKVNFIKSEKNLGFAGGHNLVLRKLKTPYALLLNSDAEVSDGSLDKIIEFARGNPTFGIVGCKLVDFEGNLQPNGGDLPFGAALINWLFNLESLGIKSPTFHRNEETYYKNPHEVGWISGGFMLIKKEVLDKVGLLNEEYFMYMEDVEFCYRAKKAGFKIMINTEVDIKHLSGGSSRENPQYRQWWGEYLGLIKLYKQYQGTMGGLFVRCLIYLTTILRMLAYALNGKFKTAQTYGKIIANI
jgi:GT2 family glycosyltransferase